MNTRRLMWAVMVLASVWTAQAQLQTAGELLLNVDPSTLSGLSDGAKVSSWTNSGTLGGSFFPAVSGQGAVYQTRVGGTPAVTFAASANSVMTNSVLPPQSILSNNIWSAEIWVLNPTLESPEDQLVWTDRGGWVGSADGTCMEIRYCGDSANAVEHYNGACNIPWTSAIPQAGLWHHVVITRDASGVERLYADGVLKTTKTPAVANLRGGGRFALGGVWDRGASNWQMLFSGSLARARVHSGTLSAAQVVNNYLFELPNFQAVWAGTPGSALPWSDAGNWLDGNVADAGETAWVTNGGTAVLSSSVTLGYLFPISGGLIISNGATLAVSPLTTINMADGAGKTFALDILEGRLALPGSSTVNLYGGVNGGSATFSVGGSGATAVLDVDRDTIVANSSGSTGVMTVGAGGGVYNSNGWFYVANNIGAVGQMTVNGGTVGFRLADKAFVVNVNGARGDVTVNSGLIDATGDFQWSAGTATNVSRGVVTLNAGALRAKRFYGVNTVGTNLLYLDGGTVQARDSRTDFMYNLTAAYVRSGGVTFDVPSGVAVTAAQGLTEDAGSTGGGVTKTGAGRITFSGVNTFSGNIDVQAGDLFFSNASGLPSGYAGAVSVANEGSIGYNKTGGAAQLLSRLNTASSGYLTLFANNSADAVSFASFPNMKLAFQNVANYTGTFTPYQGAYTFKVEGSVVTNAAVLTNDGATPGHLSVTGVSGGGMVLTGNSTFTGGAEFDAATVTIGHANALGTQADLGVPDVQLRNGAVLRFVAAMDLNAFVTNRLTADSTGLLLIGSANASQSVNLSGHPGIVVGAADYTVDYSGRLTPDGTTYRLGGGNTAYVASQYRGLSLSNLTDNGSATAVVVGTPGIVELKTGNTFSGGTVVTNRGVLYLAADGLGAVPASADAANLYVNNGVVRAGPANFTLNVNRGVTVGAGGMELHPWGSYSMTVLGNLAGSGWITTTDIGTVSFGGEANTFTGPLTINGGCNIRIGSGANFSWASTLNITNGGTLYLKTDSAKSFANTVVGGGAVRKEGSGALTLTGVQNYAGRTYIDAGALKVSATNVLPRGSGRGIVEIASGAALDAAGGNLLVGGLVGAGTVTNSTGAPAVVYVGETNVVASFSGTIDPSLALVKIASSTQTLTSASGAASQVSVQAGTLGLLNATLITGAVSVADGATLSVSMGAPGLVGDFFTLSTVPVTSDFVSLAAVNAFLSGKTPSLTTNSTYLGTYLDMGASGAGYTSKFPTGFADLFVVRWSGLFYAETAGSYAFSTASDDGSMVFIDGAVAFDNNAMQSYTPADGLISTPITLTAGFHSIVIVMYENAGDQGLTVWLTPPGGPQTLLPNALLFSDVGNGTGANVRSLSGTSKSRLVFGNLGQPTLRVTGDASTTFAGTILGTNETSKLTKEGSGTLTLSSNGSDHYGTLDVRSGTLVLTNGPSTLGTLAMGSGATTRVAGLNGLEMQFFNRSATDASYTKFQTLDLFTAYLSSTFPSGPNYVTNSLMLGSTLDTGTAGTGWPTLYVQGSGAEQETFDAYLFGSIYLDRTGLYTFGTGSDDGSMLYLDGVTVVNNGYDQGVTYRYGTATLASGFHSIAIAYRENTGGNALRAYIAYPGGATNLLPQSILFNGAVLRGLAGEAGSALDLGSLAAVVLEQSANTVHAGTIVGGASSIIQKNKAGTLTLADDNAAYAGKYIVNGGTLRVGDGGATGALGPTASVQLATGAVLAFDRTGTVTVDGLLVGTGLIRLDGPGEVYVTSTNTFAGRVQINNGRLTFAPGATLCAGAPVTNAGVIEVATTNSRLQSALMGTLNGTGGLEVTGTGLLALNAANTYSGTTRVGAGATLRVSNVAQLGGGGDVALDGGTLAILPDVEPGTNELAAALDPAAWRLNGCAVWTNRYSSNWIQLTPNTASQAGSAYCNTKVAPSVPWYASFRYEVGDHIDNAADGMAFVLQNSSATNGALGASGGTIGINGVTPSVGMFVNIYNAPAIGWIIDGNKVDAVTAINGVNPTNGMNVAMSYDGLKLTLTVTQDAKSYVVTRAIDLNAKFGGSTAYVGFSGGTGGKTAQQFVGDFSLTGANPASTDFGNALTVADAEDGTLALAVVNDGMTFGLTGIGLGSDATLNVSVAAGSSKANTGYAVAASNVTVAAGTATVHVAANGAGAGVLALNTLTFGSGAKLVVTGAAAVPGGVLTVVVPTPVPRGITQLADFTGATWVGGSPTIALVDTNGNPINETTVLRNGRLYINTIKGVLVLLR